jgi:predicted anti-sigma-YlaC factor YlaD
MNKKLDCQAVSRLISAGLDQELSAPLRARVRLHFVICRTCRNVNEQFGFLRRAVKELDKEPPLAE